MKQCLAVCSVVLLIVGISLPVAGQSKPVQLALVNPIQIFPEGNSISGIRLSLLYGKNTTVTGIDWGLVNHTTSGTSLGWQTGLVGLNDASFTGLQSCVVNLTESDAEGAQWGLYNYAGHMNGLQLGLINNAASMKGLQIGLINIIRKGGQFPIFPIVNWSF